MTKYRAVCTGNALDTSREKKTPYVKLSFLTLYNHDDPTKPANKEMCAALWLSENAISRTLNTLSEVFGWRGDDLEELNVKGELLAGIEADIVTDRETYNGKSREKIQFVNYPGKSSMARMEDASAATISKSLKGKLLAHRQSEKDTVKKDRPAPVKRNAETQASPKPPSAPPVTQVNCGGSPADSDDLPF